MATLKPEDLYVFDELENLLPPASSDEISRLKDSVDSDGFRDPIIYWANPPDNKPCVVDGHRRYRLYMNGDCGDLKLPTKGMRFADLDAVKEWMLKTQLERRNLTRESRDAVLARLLELEKAKTPSADQRNQNDYVAQGRAVERVAQKTGVPAPTVQRASKADAERRQARVKIKKADPRFDEQLDDGEIELSDADIRLLGSFKPSDIKEKIVKIRLGQDWKPAAEAPAAPGNVHPMHQKPKKKTAGKPLVKELKKTIGPVSRALEKAGNEHGRDEHYKAIFEAVKDIKETLESWLSA